MTGLRVDRLRLRSARGVDRAAAARRARPEPHVGDGSRHRRSARLNLRRVSLAAQSRRPAGPERQPRHSRAPLRPPHAAPRARESQPDSIEVDAHRAGCAEPPAKTSGAPWSGRAEKSPSARFSSFPRPTGAIELEAEVLERGQFGERLLRFKPVDDFFAVLDRIGHMPLPPYIRRDDATRIASATRRSYSRERGSVAAPTAGLHFTPQILDALAAQRRRNRPHHAARRPGHLRAAARRARGRSPPAPRALHALRSTPPTPSIAPQPKAAASSPSAPRSSARWNIARFKPPAARSNPTPARRKSSSPPASNSAWSAPCSPTSTCPNPAC